MFLLLSKLLLINAVAALVLAVLNLTAYATPWSLVASAAGNAILAGMFVHSLYKGD